MTLKIRETMKTNKIFFTLALCLSGLLVSCDPAVDRTDMGGSILTVDELNISATPVQVNGLNTSEIAVKNASPILSRWLLDGSVKSKKPEDVINVERTGTVTIVFEGYNPDGTVISKPLEVTVDVLAE